MTALSHTTPPVIGHQGARNPMVIAFKIIALQLCWLSCLGIYLSSPQQKLIKNPLPAKITRGFFVVVTFIAYTLLSKNNHALTAFIILLSIWMISWTQLALLPPHRPHIKKILALGSTIALIAAILGGRHVV